MDHANHHVQEYWGSFSNANPLPPISKPPQEPRQNIPWILPGEVPLNEFDMPLSSPNHPMRSMEEVIGKLNHRSAEIVIRYFIFNMISQQWSNCLIRELNKDLPSPETITRPELRKLFFHLRREDQKFFGPPPEYLDSEVFVQRLHDMFRHLRQYPQSGKTACEAKYGDPDSGPYYGSRLEEEAYERRVMVLARDVKLFKHSGFFAPQRPLSAGMLTPKLLPPMVQKQDQSGLYENVHHGHHGVEHPVEYGYAQLADTHWERLSVQQARNPESDFPNNHNHYFP
ncbi:MAG: hypothetical protein Q9170_004598 [Blastenia crenularia]